jgi:hypothetical protein
MPRLTFLSENIVPEITRLQEKQFLLPSFVMMMQTIEYLGAVLDGKPLKAREQSKKRFSAAIKKLFDSRYHYYNRNNELYDHLRNHLMHAFSAGSHFNICFAAEAGDQKHLAKNNDGKVVVIAEEMLKDIEIAMKKCKNMDLTE